MKEFVEAVAKNFDIRRKELLKKDIRIHQLLKFNKNKYVAKKIISGQKKIRYIRRIKKIQFNS